MYGENLRTPNSIGGDILRQHIILGWRIIILMLFMGFVAGCSHPSSVKSVGVQFNNEATLEKEGFVTYKGSSTGALSVYGPLPLPRREPSIKVYPVEKLVVVSVK